MKGEEGREGQIDGGRGNMERGRGKRRGREGGVEGGVEGGRKGTEDINRSIASDNSVQLYIQPHL